MRSRGQLISWLIWGAVMLAGCASAPVVTTATLDMQIPTATELVHEDSGEGSCQDRQAAYTGNGLDGNHFVDGAMDLLNAQFISVEVGGELLWVVGLGNGTGSRWLVSDTTGRLTEVVLQGEQAKVASFPASWPQAAPLAIVRNDSGIELVGNGVQPFSATSHPILLPSQEIAAVAADGQLILTSDSLNEKINIMALPDARLLLDGSGRIALYTNPTNRYQHAVLGDEFEAAGLTIVEPTNGEILWSFQAPDQSVFEGLAPIWVDLDQDGQLELIATISDAGVGARYGVIRPGEGELAGSQPIGQGFRWRHAIAAAPLAPNGAWELVGVRTPHLGRTVEFLQWQGNELIVTAELSGYSSHRIGSRNLDQALVADFDDDGRYELLVPTMDFNNLAAISRVEGGAAEAWRIPLTSRLTTNLAVACHRGEALALAVGLEGGQMNLWIP